MEGDLIKVNRWLTPLSWLYGLAVDTRNALFDMGVLKSVSYNIPIINVGNITVGGTGKTPHVEYLVRLLSAQYKVAVLSRGYKRKTRGYILATPESTVTEIGDEAWQMKRKFPDIYVAVDGNRRRGIERLTGDEATRDVDVILLDDAYQHRYVKPGLNILLVDYHRMISEDSLLPAGRLREKASAKSRANIVIVSKCPYDITPMGIRVIRYALKLRPYQKLFFSTMKYSGVKQLFGEETIPMQRLRTAVYRVLLLTAIGSPQQMEQDVKRFVRHITPMTFPDHHYFSKADGQAICDKLRNMPQPSIIITTEKDAAKLRVMDGLDETTRLRIYVLPTEVSIQRDETSLLNKNILDYVRSNKKHS